mmetsp:Transcript_110987/g.345911  ORF Transcript_110987/g.345911 Transcript_110987/m.345911 type:complete len:113 (+) Transcript_110987:82-420(+)
MAAALKTAVAVLSLLAACCQPVAGVHAASGGNFPTLEKISLADGRCSHRCQSFAKERWSYICNHIAEQLEAATNAPAHEKKQLSTSLRICKRGETTAVESCLQEHCSREAEL